MAEFRSSLLCVGNEIEQAQFEDMKFYCKEHIGAGILEKLKRPIHLFDELEKRTLLGPTQKDFLADLLGKVGRQDLKSKLLGIVEVQTRSPRSTVENAPTVTGTLSDTHLGEISEELARDWKQLGRKLRMNANQIDTIDTDNSKVKEKTFQIMLQWKRQNGGVATGQALADALTLIGRKDVAEHLAEICQGDAVNNVQSQNSPAENINHQDPFENMPNNLISALPVPIQDTKNPRKEEKEEILDTDDTDGPQHNIEPHTAPIQDTISPTLQPSLGGILDPDRYFVIKQIGSGSCGKVYWCTTKDRLYNYAVKQVELGMNNKDTQKKVKHLKKEIEILKRLRHECIVAYYHSEDTHKTLSIFMEYIPGGSVSDYVINHGEMQEGCVRKYTYQLLKGCEYLHQNNVIHRDIKGANVLIDAKQNIRLADFGIAKNLESVVTSTGSTSFCGTIYWCSPEHIENETPTYVFDVWSIGCTVVEMLTTKPPNRHLTHVQAFNKIVKKLVHPPDHLSPMAKAFIELCFKDKEERPNATDLLHNEFPSENVPDAIRDDENQ